MWTQLNGVNQWVQYAELDVQVTATVPANVDVTPYISVNRIWNNLDYANMIDVDKDGLWQRIYMTVSLFGQDVELILVNANFVCDCEYPEYCDICQPLCTNCEQNPCACCPVCGNFPCPWIWTLLGDVNGDGVVDWDDVQLLILYLQGADVEIHYGNANLTGNRELSWNDVQALIIMLQEMFD